MIMTEERNRRKVFIKMDLLQRRAFYKKKIILKILSEEILDIVEDELTPNKKKKLWIRSWMARKELGTSAVLLKELQAEDPQEFKLCMRMSPDKFNFLLGIVKPVIQRSDTTMRAAIPAETKLHLTLTFLTTGVGYRWLQNTFRVSKASISTLIPEVCQAIYEGLSEYIKVPSTDDEWKKIEEGFRLRWNFPNCYGAIDGKHILMQAPPNSGSSFFNYKKDYSIILLALVDHDYCFTYIDVGAHGSADSGVFNNSPLVAKLENNFLPEDGFIVGDDAFPLKTYLLKPYARTNLTHGQKVFNYRLSRARRIVENAFGVLVSRFRIFRTPILISVESTEKLVLAACTLHNWLRRTSPNCYTPPNFLDREDVNQGVVIRGAWREQKFNIAPFTTAIHRYSQKAINLRDEYQEFFLNEGQVPWQDKMVSKC